MSTDLTHSERVLFHQLIEAAGTLATVTDNANSVLSEEHQNMTQGSVDAVRAILEKCPAPTEAGWDGELHDHDLEEKTITTGRENGAPNIGVSIVHKPTGIGRESQSKPTQEQNREVVMKSLRKAVAAEYKSREG